MDKAQRTEVAGKKSSALEQYLYRVITNKPGLPAALLRVLLAALAPVYCIGLEAFLLPYRLGVRKRYRLGCPVICIGNLTTGGTGKTPMTQAVCRMLLAAGLQPAVLSRGYGGQNEYGCAIASDRDGVMLNAAQAGDEAYLLATTLPGVPVVVGKDRRVTGKLAFDKFQPDVIVLDDGMQFWQLHRDLDVILLNAARPFDNGYTFPRGLLREPVSHLRRAGVVVVTGADETDLLTVQRTLDHAAKVAPGVPIFTGSLKPVNLRRISDGVEYSPDWIRNRRLASVCAIGNPGAFEDMLRSLHAEVEPRYRFRDHEAVSCEELSRVVQDSVSNGVDALITTEKDAVRLDFSSDEIPVMTLGVEMALNNTQEFQTIIVGVTLGKFDRAESRKIDV